MAMKDFSKVHVLVDLNCSRTFERDWRTGFCCRRRRRLAKSGLHGVKAKINLARIVKNQPNRATPKIMMASTTDESSTKIPKPYQ